MIAAPTPTVTARTRVSPIVSARLRPLEAMQISGVRVQGFVQRDALAGSRTDLEPAGDAVAPELQSGLPGDVGRLHRAAIGSAELGAGSDVGARLHDAVVTERDADAG